MALAEYVDDGYSGGSLERPEMQRLILDVQSGNLTHVIVYKLDRLSRSQKDTLYLIEDVFLPHNVAFVSLQESFNTSTAFGRAVIGILSVFAQLERENIYERTRSGMQKRVEAGYWMGGGRVPFGYDYDRAQGILVPNQDAPKVRSLYELYLQGYSLQHIADLLGLKYEKLASQILTRKSNVGYIVYNGVEYPGRHAGIVSLETYEKAMVLMKERSQKRYCSTTGHLLSGLVYCGCCGAKMRYFKWGKSCYKLVCYSQAKSKPYLVRDPDCSNAKADAAEIERIVVEDILAMIKQEDAVFPQKEPIDVLFTLKRERNLEAQKLKRLYQRYAAAEDEILTDAIDEQRALLRRMEDRLAAAKEAEKVILANQEALSHFRGAAKLWDKLTIQEQQNAVRSVVERITIHGDTVRIEYKL